MNPVSDDLSREERAALRHLREQVRQQHRIHQQEAKKASPDTSSKPEKEDA